MAMNTSIYIYKMYITYTKFLGKVIGMFIHNVILNEPLK